MKPEYVVYVLTALAAVVVVLTRLRLTKDAAAGRHQVGLGILNVHTFCGVLALVGWIVYLVGANDLVGDRRPRLLVARDLRRTADPAALAAQPGQARHRRPRRQLVGGAGPVRTGPCRDARRRAGVHVVLRLALTVAVAATLLAGPTVVAPAAASESRPVRAAYASQVIGYSVKGRPIVAWHLGETRKPKVVLIAGMHGNEPAPTAILRTLRDGRTVHGIDLWVVPSYNPDGLARGTRRNAHGVDLNRNYPYHWAPLTGSYYSGPKPASEPETRAMMRFLRKVEPDWILSRSTSPCTASTSPSQRPGFARRVARIAGTADHHLDCGGVCHGTMTGWYNHRSPGFALTVEYGARPSRHLMTRSPPARCCGCSARGGVRTSSTWCPDGRGWRRSGTSVTVATPPNVR